jgi:glycosyltransferase involved in cell wall biosynthesis
LAETLRVGVVTGEYPPMPGGVGAYTACLVREWAALGVRVSILARPQAQEACAGITLHNVVPGWGLPALALIRHWAQQQRLDVINLQYQTAIYDMSPWMHFLPHVAPVPVVTTFHDLLVPYLFPKAGRLRPWIVRELAKRSAAAVTTNEGDYAQLADLPQRHLIPIGSNIPVFPLTEAERAAQRAAAAASDELLLLHFGFLYPNRGVEALFHALRVLLDVGERVRLVMVGGREGGPTDAAYVARLDALADQLRLTPYVTWTGYADEQQVSAWLQTADWVVLPFLDGASYRRGSLIAAVVHGCAVITTRPTVPLTGLEDGEHLLYVPTGEGQAIAELLRRVGRDEALRARLRCRLSAARAMFEWPQIARQFLDVFAAVARG